MKIVSFGDSFIWGTEISGNQNGELAWPGLIASRLNVNYETRAIPGCGNDAIFRQILEYFADNTADLAVINWTWATRYDFYLAGVEKWITLGPTCVPHNLQNLVTQETAEELIGFNKRWTGNSILWNRYRSLEAILSAQTYLKTLNVSTIETYIDHDLFFGRKYHAPGYIQTLQNLTQHSLLNFEGQTFLDWSRSRGFAITDPGLHPLEQAHNAAADLWLELYQSKLHQ